LASEIDTIGEDINKFVNKNSFLFTTCLYYVQASSHINSNEIIVTYGYSTTILNFLLAVDKSRLIFNKFSLLKINNIRNFEVIIVESSYNQTGQKMAQELSKNNI
jgi:translation initiation factor 2B subunit (eIF-2B alpha/beta/delta family)